MTGLKPSEILQKILEEQGDGLVLGTFAYESDTGMYCALGHILKYEFGEIPTDPRLPVVRFPGLFALSMGAEDFYRTTLANRIVTINDTRADGYVHTYLEAASDSEVITYIIGVLKEEGL